MERPHVMHMVVCLLLVTGVLTCAAWEPAFDDAAYAHLENALRVGNMRPSDLSFEKDVGRPTNTLGYVQEMLATPLALPGMADRLMVGVVAEDPGALWRVCGSFLETGIATAPPPDCPAWVPSTNALADPVLVQALAVFVSQAGCLVPIVTNAWRALSRADREYLAASDLGSVDRVAGSRLAACGIPRTVTTRLHREEDALDPEPAAMAYLRGVEGMDYGMLLGAGMRIEAAVRGLERALAGVRTWPAAVIRLPSPWGAVVVGTPGDDVYREAAFLVVDPGGDDLYTGQAAVANGLVGLPVACVIDRAGNDRYRGSDVLGAASALFGVACLVDGAGDDTYTAAHVGQAAAVQGVAVLIDRAGDDRYRARMHGQAAATGGLAILRDAAGLDSYEIGMRGQAYAGVRGMGLLIDDQGNDRYVAGGQSGDHERHAEHFVSLAQGFATGARPFAGGGVAALVDRRGNDVYIADVYGQGVGYWYAVGMLIDGGGHDRYSLHEYGQGAGIHLSFGLLVECGGNDVYYGWSLAQGCAHDYAVGMLIEKGGHDTYTADHFSQGRGINNALGLMLDHGGADAYFARQPDSCQGVGHISRKRDYGSVSLHLDLAGADRYSCGISNGVSRVRGDVGVVYDYDPPEVAE